MDQHRYARQKLLQAVESLVGDSKMRNRLGCALTHLALLAPEDFPEELRLRFKKIMKQLNDSRVEFAYKHCEVNAQAPRSGRIAREILDIYVTLRGGL